MGAPWVIHPRYPRPAIDQLKPRHRKYFLQPRRLLHQKSGYVPAWTAWRYRNGQQPWKAPANKIEHAVNMRPARVIPLKTGAKGITFAPCPETLRLIECGQLCSR